MLLLLSSPKYFISIEIEILAIVYGFLLYIGLKLYNMIPKGIKEAKTADDFKDRLK